jgi:hypothetical protein
MNYEMSSTEEFTDFLFKNRSELPPQNPNHGDFFMNLQSEIFVFLEKEWVRIEGIKIENDPVPSSSALNFSFYKMS